MTQEEKAKRYDKALEKAKDFYEGYKQRDNQLYADDLETIFPELKESEDEETRKALIQLVGCMSDADHRKERWLDWLEKQGEKKPQGKSALEVLKEEKVYNSNKIEPKFKLGDKIRIKTPSSWDKDMQVARIEKDYYICNHIGKFSSEVVPFSKESNYELIEQNPIIKMITPEESLGISSEEYNKIVDECVYSDDKSTWDKKDEQILNAAILHIKNETYNYYGGYSSEYIMRWLKSLKDRIGG